DPARGRRLRLSLLSRQVARFQLFTASLVKAQVRHGSAPFVSFFLCPSPVNTRGRRASSATSAGHAAQAVLAPTPPGGPTRRRGSGRRSGTGGQGGGGRGWRRAGRLVGPAAGGGEKVPASYHSPAPVRRAPPHHRQAADLLPDHDVRRLAQRVVLVDHHRRPL